MPIAITDDHIALAETVRDFLEQRKARAAARALLEAPEETDPSFWSEAAGLGWLGLHVPEAHGGSGYSLEELVVVVEELGRAVTPGAFVPTVIASAVIAAAGDEALSAKLLPGLADGSVKAAVALGGSVSVSGGAASGDAGVALGATLADVLIVGAGADVAVVDLRGGNASISTPKNIDPTRRSSVVTLSGASADVLPGARGLLHDHARTILSAEAVGVAAQATQMAADYARDRLQFGRPIAMYQAVKHHCANMLVKTELATAAVWDAARASSGDPAQFSYAASIAATLSAHAADFAANHNTQVHGGIGFTWEHDAHLYTRRATALVSLLDGQSSAAATVDLLRQGVRRERAVDLPPEAEVIRTEVRAFVDGLKGLDKKAVKERLVQSGYAMPHWPLPYGRNAGAIEQLVIEQEFKEAGIEKPQYGITGWVILTLIQHGTPDQVARWVQPALDHEVIWCQLFSEPDAGSDAAGIKTKATRVDGGWLINGQKVWTSGAHVAGQGFITVRTNPDVPKHQGITTMVVDMHAKGVEVRPLRQQTGGSDFNEVFFNDVFVPDDDVVGPVDGGWTVARATLGNESVSIGGGSGGMSLPPEALIASFDANPSRLYGGAQRIGTYVANHHAMGMLNLRATHRAVAGGGPGPEGAMTKLILSELGHDAASITTELAGPGAAFTEGDGAISSALVLSHRGMSIAGGTSEIKRNQIGERLLGLPRDPLIK